MSKETPGTAERQNQQRRDVECLFVVEVGSQSCRDSKVVVKVASQSGRGAKAVVVVRVRAVGRIAAVAIAAVQDVDVAVWRRTVSCRNSMRMRSTTAARPLVVIVDLFAVLVGDVVATSAWPLDIGGVRLLAASVKKKKLLLKLKSV